ncbi:MAG: non-canonical purine NTP pyrophosphatase [Candidatus Levybacteria bacterium]|nr:non-canonical purine NTP pyrophosphatase [Candidatus Levybacteria bacterium]
MNKLLHFISSNEAKVKEAQLILGFPVEVTSLDLLEIQGNDIVEIVRAKALEAFKQINEPVIVDDVGFYISAWNGFPGPLVKWLLKSGGSALILKMLLNETDRKAEFVSAIGFHDGNEIHTFIGKVSGTIAHQPRSTRKAPELETIFVPDGYKKTYAEMTLEEKSQLSHRKKSLELLKNHLQTNNG